MLHCWTDLFLDTTYRPLKYISSCILKCGSGQGLILDRAQVCYLKTSDKYICHDTSNKSWQSVCNDCGSEDVPGEQFVITCEIVQWSKLMSHHKSYCISLRIISGKISRSRSNCPVNIILYVMNSFDRK
jgi:hypothetical protein